MADNSLPENVKYFIILREGENAGKGQEFYAPKEAIERVFDGFGFDKNGVCYAELGHIAGQEKGETEDELKIDKKKSLLEFTCQNEITANKCVAYWKLGTPFSDCNN
jgi:hypothetical protein